MADDPVSRHTLRVRGQELSYLRAGEGSPLLLLHGTYWSRVWAPVITRLTQNPQCLRSTIPALAVLEAGLPWRTPGCRGWPS